MDRLDLSTQDQNRRHFLNMSLALRNSFKTTCPKRKVGTIIVDKHNNIQAKGFNSQERFHRRCLQLQGEKCLSIHAEKLALQIARIKRLDLKGSLMYVTHEPCIECCDMILESGISTLVLIEPYKNHEGIQRIKDQIELIYLKE